VSPIGWAFQTLEETLDEAQKSAAVTHDHPEGIKGAQSVAAAIFLGRTGKSKEEIKRYLTNNFGYNLERNIRDIREIYDFEVSCQDSVPEAIIAFLESNDFEQAIRLAISIGGDSDTIACITGGIAEAFYGEVPKLIEKKVLEILPEEFKMLAQQFSIKHRSQE
jgi:ADP-ribosylglycohydrolase